MLHKLEITANFHNSMCAKSLSSAKYTLKGATILDAQFQHYKYEIFPPPTMDRHFHSGDRAASSKSVLFPQVCSHCKKLITVQVR